MPSFTPLGNRVCLRRLDAAALAPSSTFTMPENAKEKAQECEVVAVPGQPWMTEYGVALYCPCFVGDRVLIGKYSGSEHKITGEDGKQQEVLFVRWDELLAVEPADKVPEEAPLQKQKAAGKVYYTPDPAATKYAEEFAKQLADRPAAPAVHPRAVIGMSHPNAKETSR